MSTTEASLRTPGFQSLRSRYAILASFYLAVLLATPFWLKTTSIERLPLPRHDVVAWESRLPCPVRIDQAITLYFPPDIIKPAEEHIVAEDLQRGLRAAGDGVWAAEGTNKDSVLNKYEQEQIGLNSTSTLQAKPLEYAACIDWNIRVKSSIERRVVTGLHYEIEFLGSNATESTVISTSTGRRFQAALPAALHPDNDLTSEEVSSIVGYYLAKLLQLPYTRLFYSTSSPIPSLRAIPDGHEETDTIMEDVERVQEDRRRVPYTRNLRLVFSLINEDISAFASASSGSLKDVAGVLRWNRDEVKHLFKKRFGPLLKALAGTQSFHKELQVTWFAPLQFEPKLLEVEVAPPPPVDFPDDARSVERDDESNDEEGSLDHVDEDALREDIEVDHLNDLIAMNEGDEEIAQPAPNETVKGEVEQSYLIDWEDIKIFVNSGEWSLTSGAITSPLSSIDTSTTDGATAGMSDMFEQTERTLHFVLYVPKPSHRPLRVAGDAEATTVSDAKGWLIPQWGGVSLFNLGFEGEERSSDKGKMLQSLSAAEMDDAFAIFEKQFNSLLGLQDLEVTGLADDVSLAWKLDALTRQRIMAASRECVKTLGSIIRLVDKIENLGVDQSVRDDVSRALLLLDQAIQLSNTSVHDTHTTLSEISALSPFQVLLDLVHSSELLSSRAFFNPSMLGQLYFPDEHKYAVYTPLFGPLAVPLLVAGVRLFKERRKAKAVQAAALKAK
ncbi:hypothetical protein CBS101457_005426 [Exobasidium rhododendri]|nr:hypothetical protein CBS101457_005426 [Exobasidium rhododendri]